MTTHAPRTYALAVLLLALLPCAAACDDAPEPAAPAPTRYTGPAPELARDGALAFDIVLAEGASPGMDNAAIDLIEAAAHMTGAPAHRTPIHGALSVSTAPTVVYAVVDPDAAPALGDEGYAIADGLPGDGRPGVTITARTHAGAMFGLYGLIGEMGVQFFHPEETFYPAADPAATLPWDHDGTPQAPAFARRGLHEHTQHPIVMSDYYLRPGHDDFRVGVSRYLRWMARNRQNSLSFHTLNTIDLDTWLPYMKSITDEAHGMHLQVGFVTSFADQQQHNFKLIHSEAAGTEEEQIVSGLDRFMEGGFDFITFQVGTSEFTQPEPGAVVRWLNTAVAHLRDTYPHVRPFTWIHVTCDLYDETGGMFFHQPFQADPDLGALVHTTMFYTLTDPAPVYDCQDFTHQLDAFALGDGQRELVFFPESAWWLGFDNNLPVLLPLTGLSRQRDIAHVRADYDTTGHITFTTGREWTYWQYDHYLHRATWDATLTWNAYLHDLAPLYGASSDVVPDVLAEWTTLQEQHFYKDNPLIYFYLAGELPQDEVGEQAGVIARRPKLALSKVLRYDQAEFDAWKTRDYDLLVRMRAQYAALRDRLPPVGLVENQADRLNAELRRAADLYVLRLDHAILLYGAVIDLRNLDRIAAEARLAEARAISQQAISIVEVNAREVYRYPLALLAEPKPDTLTVYPFGYLYETSTGFFWTRRDTQLADLIERVFAELDETWTGPPAALFSTETTQIKLTRPANPLAGSVLAGFFPRFLWAHRPDAPALSIAMATDHNDNGLPDQGSELLLTATPDADGLWPATAASFDLDIYSSTGEQLGTLTLLDSTFTATPTLDNAVLTELGTVILDTSFASDDLIEIIQSVAGIDRDGVENLLADVFGVPTGADFPERLEVTFELGTAVFE